MSSLDFPDQFRDEDNSPYYTPKQVAKRLNLSLATIYSLIKRGLLCAHRHSASGRHGVYRVHVNDLASYEVKSRLQPQSHACNEPAKRSGGPFQILDGERLASRRPANAH